MSAKQKMSRKRRHSAIEECNNNSDTQAESDEKRKRKMERLEAQLKSDLTEKITEKLKSPDGKPTNRFGRVVRRSLAENDRKTNTMTEHTQSLSKRKVRKVFSIHKPSTNACLRLVSNRPTTVLAKSPIQKLISVSKIGLKNHHHQFQRKSHENTKKTDLLSTTTNGMCESIDTTNVVAKCCGQFDEKIEINDSMQSEPVDFEENLKVYHLVKNRGHRTESFEIIDEIDLTSSTEGSEGGFDTKSHDDTEFNTFSTTELAVTPMSNASREKTDSPKIFATPAELANVSIALTDCVRSPRLISESIVYDDKPFSDGTSDDCVIADYDDIHSDIDTSDNWYVGQIVWAALFTYPFWPAIIFNSQDEHTFRKDNQIHVKFLYDSGRHNWVNEKSSILPFKGRDEFVKQCKLPMNKRNKACRLNTSKKWELAVHEANVLLCVKPEHRVDFYDKILLNVVRDVDHELRSSRRKTGDRCDTPQTFDTAYSSLKQSSSPASLSPSLNELDRNYDVDKNINNYLKSVEMSHPEELPEEDLQLDESPSFASLTESPSSTDQIHCRLAKLVHDKLREFEIPVNANAISKESQFVARLNELWAQLTDVKLTANTSSSTTRTRRRFSICSISSMGTSTCNETKQTARQKALEIRKAKEEAKKEESIVIEIAQPPVKKPTREELLEKKQKIVESIILDCYIRNHPANFLLKGLAKGPICQCCLKSGTVLKCAGKCSAYFHKECLNNGSDESQYNNILKKKLLSVDDETASVVAENVEKLQCEQCKQLQPISCFICSKSDGDCIPCCDKNCGKAYHLECFKYWPQYKENYPSGKTNSKMSFHCPRHICHNCISCDIRNMFHKIESDKKLMKCLLCPGTYHRSSNCIPAGSELLSESQMICARHQSTKKMKHIDYCLFCSKGGSLILCDTCVYAFHQECLKVPVGDHFICEECESGRRPLNGEIVWCKYTNSPWWPAIIVPPPLIPEAVRTCNKEPNQICVYFFGTYDYGWVAQSQIYLYIKGDGDFKSKNEKEKMQNAVAEAEQWKQRFDEINEKNVLQINKNKTHPPYKNIKTNKVTAKFVEAEYSECKCRPEDPAPCSMESNCYNAVLNIECDPELCPAKAKCQNQNFHRGEQFAFYVKMTDSRGWGLYAKEEIPVDRFIIEYMGEVIDSVEFEQRFSRATANKDDNFYFLTLGNNLYIDAKVYGNEARFINHSCDPNVAPNKWTVYSNGHEHIRIGFFALRKILPGEEITFDYNWGITKNMKTVCQCGSKKCRGYI